MIKSFRPIIKSEITKSINLCVDSYEDYAVQSKNGEMQAIFDQTDNDFYIAIRGSDSLWDWLFVNLDIKLISPYEDVNVKLHSGFYHAKGHIIDQVYNVIKRQNKKNLIFTGHSMGAAVSQIMALNFALDNPEYNVRSINFACPNLGNHPLKYLYNKHIETSLTVNNCLDPVSRVWPTYMNPSEEIHGFVSLNPNIHGVNTYRDLVLTNY